MGLIDRLVVIAAKFVSLVSASLGLGAGETWPGEIALRLRPDILSRLSRSLSDGVVVIAGTNGKTTTALMTKTIFEHIGDTVVHNATGANLLNGVVSSFIRNSDWLGRVTSDVGIFEIDENSLPIVLRYMTPSRIVLLNLFRDQLDRYGEVDVIVEKWQKALSRLPKSTMVIANSDDPGIASLARAARGQVRFFGLTDRTKFLKEAEHATDSTFCPRCGARLTYEGNFYSHIGIWACQTCGNRRPKPDVHTWNSLLPGVYNRYNTLAAVALAKSFDMPDKEIRAALAGFQPAFGRLEDIEVDGAHVKLLLSKNPAGFNASLRAVLEERASAMLLILNDRIPDGRDVSWVWDVDFETIPSSVKVWASGDRVYDMALRLKYAGIQMPEQRICPSLDDAIRQATAHAGRTPLYILATYSAMLDARKILKGRKIL